MECSEIAINIFVNLEPALMTVFRSVCRSWYDVSKSTTLVSDVLSNYGPIPIRSYPLCAVARTLPSSECYDIMLRNQLYDRRLVYTYLQLDGVEKWSYTPSLMKLIVRSDDPVLVKKVLSTMQLTIRHFMDAASPNTQRTTSTESVDWSSYVSSSYTTYYIFIREIASYNGTHEILRLIPEFFTLLSRHADEVLPIAIENDNVNVVTYIIDQFKLGSHLTTVLREAVRQFKKRIIAHNFKVHGWYMKGIAKNIGAHDVLEYLESLE